MASLCAIVHTTLWKIHTLCDFNLIWTGRRRYVVEEDVEEAVEGKKLTLIDDENCK